MPTIKINNTELEPATHFNYLGITIHKHTKWGGHIKKIAIKISKASGIIFKLNDVLPYNVSIYIYIIQILCVCVSVKYRRPNGWTDHDQIWHVYADRPGDGSYQKKWSHVWSGRVGSLGPFFEAGT